ncbi:hypothetical protein GCM10022284_46990 [Streptomyces hundungensis]
MLAPFPAPPTPLSASHRAWLLAAFPAPPKTLVGRGPWVAGRAIPRAPNPAFGLAPCVVARAVPRAPKNPTPAADRGWLVAQFLAPLKDSVLASAGIFSPSGD